MKANELMIGDWVQLECTKGQIHELGTMFCDCIVHDHSNIHTKTDSIRPIPLTEEILKANGFIVERLSKSCRNVQIYQTINLLDSDNCNKWFTTLCEANIAFAYVHELQHALRLCGLNDLADNFKIQ